VQRTFSLVAISTLVLLLSLDSRRAAVRADGPDGVIDGTVLGTDGKAAPQVEVKLFHGGGKNRKPIQTATTDDAGKFTFNDVEPGDYVIVAGNKKTGTGRAKTHVVPSGIVNISIGILSHRRR
jgi:hypothetical protein